MRSAPREERRVVLDERHDGEQAVGDELPEPACARLRPGRPGSRVLASPCSETMSTAPPHSTASDGETLHAAQDGEQGIGASTPTPA